MLSEQHPREHSYLIESAPLAVTETATTGEATDKPTCTDITKAGQPCKATYLYQDGKCRVHSAYSGFDPIESGRKGGRASGSARHERAKSARDLLRERPRRTLTGFARRSRARFGLRRRMGRRIIGRDIRRRRR